VAEFSAVWAYTPKNPIFGLTSIKNDISHMDSISITIKNGVVTDVKRTTMAINRDAG